MGYFPRPAAPKALWSDLKAYMADQGRFKLAGAALAIGMTSAMVTMFIVESRWGVLPTGPQIVFAEDFSAARTDDDIRRDQKIDAAKRHAAQKAKQAEFKRLADTLGIK
jgi:hypothetical protein